MNVRFCEFLNGHFVFYNAMNCGKFHARQDFLNNETSYLCPQLSITSRNDQKLELVRFHIISCRFCSLCQIQICRILVKPISAAQLFLLNSCAKIDEQLKSFTVNSKVSQENGPSQKVVVLEPKNAWKKRLGKTQIKASRLID